MYDLIAAIAVQGEGGNHLLLPVAHLRYLRAHQGFLGALRRGIEQGDSLMSVSWSMILAMPSTMPA